MVDRAFNVHKNRLTMSNIWIIKTDPCLNNWQARRKPIAKTGKERDLLQACKDKARREQREKRNERERKYISNMGNEIESRAQARFGKHNRAFVNNLQYQKGSWIKLKH